jgi:Trypsin-like peptidase domain
MAPPRAGMAERLENLLRSCTVRVLGGPAAGTGFFIAPGKVLTCFHVAGDSQALTVRWERDGQPPVEVPVLERVLKLTGPGTIPALEGGYPDIAVLEVGLLEVQPCVRIDTGWPWPEDQFQAFGYPEEGGAVQLTAARLTYRGTKSTKPTIYLDLASDKIKPGMSGAAVLNMRSGAVCGVVVASKHTAQPDGALAIHWSAIGTDLRHVLAANEAFHQQHRQWDTAAAAGRATAEADPKASTPTRSASLLLTDHASKAQRPPVVAGLPAYRLLPEWRPDRGLCPVTDAYLADLGAWLCLDRGASTYVVAAQPEFLLADALNKVEQGPVKHGQVSGLEFPERIWHPVDADVGEHELRSLRADEPVPALVVSWPAGVYRAGWPISRPARAVYEHIREALPSAPVVLLVQAEQALDAIAAAAELGRNLHSAGRGSEIDVLAHVRPGEPEPPPARTAPQGEPVLVARRLMASVSASLRARALRGLPHPADDEPLHADADPEAVAAQTVEALELVASWGAPASEALALGLVRDHASRYFLALVRQHAARRTGPARWASLYAAADFDDYVDAWLDAAPEVGVPMQVPRSLRDRRLIEAVLLGLLRRNQTGIGPWRDAARFRCDAAWQVANQAVRGTPDASFFQDAGAEVGLAAIRAAVGSPLHAGLPAPEASAAWWAAVGRSPLTERTVAALAAMSAQARRVVGFTASCDEPDPGLAELIQQLRRAMRPPLPRLGNDG